MEMIVPYASVTVGLNRRPIVQPAIARIDMKTSKSIDFFISLRFNELNAELVDKFFKFEGELIDVISADNADNFTSNTDLCVHHFPTGTIALGTDFNNRVSKWELASNDFNVCHCCYYLSKNHPKIGNNNFTIRMKNRTGFLLARFSRLSFLIATSILWIPWRSI